MTFTHAFLILAVVFLLSAIVYAVFLRFGGMLARIPSASFGNAFKAALASGLVGALICVGGLALQNKFPGQVVRGASDYWNVTMSPPIWILVVEILVMLLVTTLIVKIVLFAEFGQAAMATVVMIVPGTIFAFLFGFIMERVSLDFAVPTVSVMAPTVENAHMVVTCDNCDFRYDTRIPDWTATVGKKAAPTSYDTNCPNCGQPAKITENTPLAQGDRCLVARGATPQRWDIVCVRPGPNESGQSMYRVVGLPGESLELVGGDVFIAPPDSKKKDNKTRAQRGVDIARNMWIPVHDTRFHPQQPLRDGPQWKPARSTSNWRYEDDHWIDAMESAGNDELYFTGRITDQSGFNLTPPAVASASDDEAAKRGWPRPVGDVLVECWLASLNGSGGLTISRELAGQTVTAKIGCSGQVELRFVEEGEGGSKSATSQGTLQASVGTSAEVALAIRDGQAFVLEKNEVVAKIDLGAQDIETARARRDRIADALPNVAPKVRIGLSSGNVILRRIRLSRDVYFRSADEMPPPRREPGRPEPQPLVSKKTLKADEYFLLGDNSLLRWDSRMRGPVEAGRLSGTVGSIYWPTSRSRRLN